LSWHESVLLQNRHPFPTRRSSDLKMAECDAGGADTRLVLSREEIVDLIRVFLPENTNEARLIDQVDAHISKAIELGFIRPLKGRSEEHTSELQSRGHLVCRLLLEK